MGNVALLYRCINMGYYKDISIARAELLAEFDAWARKNYTAAQYEEVINTYNEYGTFPEQFHYRIED